MRLYAPLTVLVFSLGVSLTAQKCSAQSISVASPKLNQCGHGSVICSGMQAYSLTEIQNGALQIPIYPFATSEIVVVNDTGAAITDLQFTVTTIQAINSYVQCQIDSTARSLIKDCTTAIVGSGGTSSTDFVSVQFTYSSNNKKGIADGDYFDIITSGFLSGSYLAGPVSDGAPGINPGTGTASY